MKSLKFRIGTQVFSTGEHTLVMGILNVTPDSFSDGGEFFTSDDALKFAKTLIREGSNIIDVGGESTRPGYTEIDPEEEWKRIGETIKRITKLDTLVSVDTYKSTVAQKALRHGVHVVNDIWGLQHDSNMAHVIAEAGAAAVIMHNCSEVLPDNELVSQIKRFFERSIETATVAGVRQDGIIIDPGIGFGKNPNQNLIILRELAEFKEFGFPILVGLSRKRFIGNILEIENPRDRIYGTIGANMMAVANGADIIRVHDVKAHVDAVRVTDAILGKGNN